MTRRQKEAEEAASPHQEHPEAKAFSEAADGITEQAEPAAAWERWLKRIITTFGGVVILIMVFYVVGNALSRTLLDRPLPASIELTQYWFLPVLVTAGFVGAQMMGEHIDADLFFDKFTNRQKKNLTIGIHLLAIIVLGVGTYFTGDEAVHAMSKGIKAGFTSIPAWPAYFLIPAAFVSMIAINAVQALRVARRSPESPSTEPQKKEHV